MAEGKIDLGSDKLMVSQALGDEFVNSLERQSPESPLATSVRERLLENPSLKILGIRLQEDSQLKDVENSLSTQMGLPPGSNLKSVKDRLAGRERDFLLVIDGINSLTDKGQRKMRKRLGNLKTESVYG